MRRKIYRQAADEDGGRRDENRKIYSIFYRLLRAQGELA